MRETARMSQLLEDFRRLGEWMRGEWTPPTTPKDLKTDYGLLTSPVQLHEYLRLDSPVRTHACDTEKHGTAPWSVQMSNSPHSARMILADRTDLIAEYQWWLNETGVDMKLHFAGQDLDTLEKMGIRPASFSDTMQSAYHLCTLP